jgi:hypothetical protein
VACLLKNRIASRDDAAFVGAGIEKLFNRKGHFCCFEVDPVDHAGHFKSPFS